MDAEMRAAIEKMVYHFSLNQVEECNETFNKYAQCILNKLVYSMNNETDIIRKRDIIIAINNYTECIEKGDLVGLADCLWYEIPGLIEG
ncbi:MAG: hypothetical protein ACI4GD_06100 [Lachnospiraceae bacterium]